MDDTLTATKTQFFDRIKAYLSRDEFACVQEALELACRAHGDQRRKSGELFFTHPLTVAYYLAYYHLDVPTLTAALLHDVAEDTLITIEQIEAVFGQEVARLVDGVTKLKSVTEGMTQGRQLTPKELQDATLHKLLDAMTNDVRTVVIKLFDRLHNMRTIKAVPAYKQIRTAKETLTVYAPLANRLGIWTIKNELESCSLELIHLTAYQTIKEQLEIIQAEQKPFYETVRQEINDLLAQANIEAHISLEPQNIYTVYQDLTAKGAAYDHIDSILRLEILLNDLIECYTALGYLHQVWKPVPGKFDDYIAVPRDNLYRSLHTTVIHPDGSHIKLRLRTLVMDKVSEVGILARWLYADRPKWSQEIDKPIQIFLENIHENIHIEPQDLGAGVAGVVEDVFRQQIRVYTPRGQMVDLAKGATAVDFAYAIHTGLGNLCHTALVNGEFYPLNKPLRDGDQVNINKKPWAQPRRAWLDEDLGYIATNYARSHVRRWFRRLPDDVAITQGKNLLQAELEGLNLSTYPHQKIANSFNYQTTQQLYYCLGHAEILPTVVATRVLEDSWGQEPTRHLDNIVYAPNGEKFVIMNADGRRLRLCGTCNPRPGDAITGFLRQDNGVTVHQDSCHLVRPEHMAGRLLRLGWGEAQRQAHVITLQVDVHDRPGLLYEITDLVSDEKINISYIHTPPHDIPRQTRIILSLEIVHPRQLIRILHQIQALANVINGQVLPYGPPASKEEHVPSTMYRPE